MRIKGSKTRPRVAVIGLPLIDEDRRKLEQLFPSINFYRSFKQLEDHTSSSEIDLLILGNKVEDSSNLLFRINIISFSSNPPFMPGPVHNEHIELSNPVKTEEFIENDITLEYSRIRAKEDWTNAKGWSKIHFKEQQVLMPVYSKKMTSIKKANSIIRGGAILLDSHSGSPFATVFLNEEQKLGVAWFPLPTKHKIDWIEAIVNEWAKYFPEKFPHIGDWARQEEWLLAPEIGLLKEIKNLEERKLEYIKEIEGKIDTLNKKYKGVLSWNDKGFRKLLTEQGDELVDIVKIAFESFGFTVEKMDETIIKGKSKIEDLRITIDNNKSWEAIVEVRGYAKSSGKEGELTRLNKFAKLYNKEKEKFPDKMIYVVNGSIELLPPQRPKPFESNPDFLNSIADDDCLVVSTTTIYRVLQKLEKSFKNDISKSIIESTGEWKFVPPN